MSTPSPLYRPAGTGTIQNVLGMTHVNKLGTGETNGAFCAFELTIPPGGGAPMHRHGVDAECFYVLDGAITFLGPDAAHIALPGDLCLLPAGGAHGFRNDGGRAARALVITAPGTQAERFFGAIDAAMRDGPPSVATVTAIAARHDLTILPVAQPTGTQPTGPQPTRT